MLYPTTSEVALEVHDRSTVWTGWLTPVPVKVATFVELEALLVNKAVADAPPVAPGVNVTVKGTGWLVVTVAGNEMPLIENSLGFVPPKLAEETTTFPPVAVKVPV
jgi:hypothetical protein